MAGVSVCITPVSCPVSLRGYFGKTHPPRREWRTDGAGLPYKDPQDLKEKFA